MFLRYLVLRSIFKPDLILKTLANYRKEFCTFILYKKLLFKQIVSILRI